MKSPPCRRGGAASWGKTILWALNVDVGGGHGGEPCPEKLTYTQVTWEDIGWSGVTPLVVTGPRGPSD